MKSLLRPIIFLALIHVANAHQFVSEDGGFVMKSGFKRPMKSVERSFERYRFLREKPKMALYRTTKLKPLEVLSREAKFEYNENIKKNPVNWWLELQNKCIKEYIPKLPTALQDKDVRFFFFNQYDDVAVKVYGYSKGKIFALTIRNNPKHAASGEAWDSPVWSYTRGIDIQKDHWRNIWMLVKQNKKSLIAIWARDQKSLTKKFERGYDNLF